MLHDSNRIQTTIRFAGTYIEIIEKKNIDRIKNYEIIYNNRRKYLLTFKGSTYREGTHGSYTWELLNIREKDDVIVRLQCFKMHGWHKNKKYKKICEQLDKLYATNDYIDLFDTTFALIPGGRQPATYRLMEAMSAGALPVFRYPEVDWVKPYANLIDWDEFSLSFVPKDVKHIIKKLRSFTRDEISTMRYKANEAYRTHFGDPEHMALHLFSLARQQLMATSHDTPSTETFTASLARRVRGVLFDWSAHADLPRICTTLL